jgi:hypothetical protein
LRLASDDSLKRRIQSLLNTLQGKELLASGIADQVLFQRAVQLDADNIRAKNLLAEIDSAGAEAPNPMHRYTAPSVVGALAALAVFVLLRRNKAEPPQAPGTPAPGTSQQQTPEQQAPGQQAPGQQAEPDVSQKLG